MGELETRNHLDTRSPATDHAEAVVALKDGDKITVFEGLVDQIEWENDLSDFYADGTRYFNVTGGRTLTIHFCGSISERREV